MRIHQNVIRVAPLPSLLPAPAAPPNITRWGLHGRSPDRSNVRRGRRGKAGKPENPNPRTRVKVRMRKAPRRNFGMKLESRRLSSTKNSWQCGLAPTDCRRRLAPRPVASSCVRHLAPLCMPRNVVHRWRCVCAAQAHAAGGDDSWRVPASQGCARGIATQHRASPIAIGGCAASALQ